MPLPFQTIQPMRPYWPLVLLVLSALAPLRAVQDADGTFTNDTDPTSLLVPNWNSGWGTSDASVTGWNYVGLIQVPDGYLSGVYLGNGWVLTAAHGGTDLTSYTLNGQTFAPVAGSYHTLSTLNDGSGGQADLAMFQIPITPTLNLPTLSLAASPPAGYDSVSGNPGSATVMVGYGFGLNYGTGILSYPSESWGTGTVFQSDVLFTVQGDGNPAPTFNSVDYYIYNANSGQPDSSTNLYNLYPGDSGGANFIFNSQTQTWQLAGINEFVATATLDDGSTVNFASGFVETDYYLTQIDAIMDAPEPSTYALFAAGLVGLALYRRARANSASAASRS